MSGKAYVPPHRRRQGAGAGAGQSTGKNGNRRFPFASTSASGKTAPSSNVHNNDNNPSITGELQPLLNSYATPPMDAQVERLLNAFTYVYCINLKQRTGRWHHFQNQLRWSLGEKRGLPFLQKVKRFEAVDGNQLLENNYGIDHPDMPPRDWDATNNARYDHHIQPPFTDKQLSAGEIGCSMSHIALWRRFIQKIDSQSTLLILEDDVTFYVNPQRKIQTNNRPNPSRPTSEEENFNNTPQPHDFYTVFERAMDRVPDDWEILYLGFSDRGERIDVPNLKPFPQDYDGDGANEEGPEIHIFQPEYGFHTHAYAIKQSAASVFLANLPVRGPLDVWLADNNWFGLKVYCCVVANEGWRGTGAYLITQNRKGAKSSDIAQSGRFNHS